MGSISEKQYPTEFIQAEAPGNISRDTVTVTVAASTTLKPGTVLAQLAGSGKYVIYDNAGTDGSEQAAGILVDELVNEALSGADFKGVIINFCAEVRKAALNWAAGLTDDDKTAALNDLKAFGVKART